MRIVNDSNGKPSFPYALDCNIGTNYFLAFFVTNFPFIVDLSSKPVLTLRNRGKLLFLDRPPRRRWLCPLTKKRPTDYLENNRHIEIENGMLEL